MGSSPVMVAGDTLKAGRPSQDGNGDATKVMSQAQKEDKKALSTPLPHQVLSISTSVPSPDPTSNPGANSV